MSIKHPLRFVSLILFAITVSITPSLSQETKPSLYMGIMPMVNGVVCYSEVVRADSVSKDELYRRAKRFIAKAYKSAQDVIQLDDKESGEILAKGSFSQYWQASWAGGEETHVYHTLSIKCKDGRYKYELTQFRINYYVSPSQYTAGGKVDMDLQEWNIARPDNLKKYLNPLHTQIVDFTNSLIIEMSTQTQEVNDNW